MYGPFLNIIWWSSPSCSPFSQKKQFWISNVCRLILLLSSSESSLRPASTSTIPFFFCLHQLRIVVLSVTWFARWARKSSALTSFPKYNLVGRTSMSRSCLTFDKNDLYATPLSPLKPGLNKGNFKASCVSSWQIIQELQFISQFPRSFKSNTRPC